MTHNKSNSPIFVTGIERSGSSIIARIISHSGAFTGNVSEMYENTEIKELLDRYYELIGADKRGQKPLPDTKKLIMPVNWEKTVKDIMGNKIWMLKSSRICQTWPLWYQAFPNAKWIIVRRRTGDIINSCMKTGYMKAYSDSNGWLNWIHTHEKLFVNMIKAGMHHKQVWPERMATGDFQQIEEMIDWVGLEWDENLPKIIEPLMWNSHQRTNIRKE